MAVALVLSGGAAQGSFEVGALKYLYEKGFCANIICSTSVGSVNGLQLAHGGDPASQKAAFAKLASIWETELKFNADMYTEAAWLASVSPSTRKAIETSFASVDWGNLVAWGLLFPPFFVPTLAEVITEVVTLVDAFKRREVKSVFSLDPTRALIDKNLDPNAVASSGVELRLVVVSLDSGAIRYVTQAGRVIETNGQPVVRPNQSACQRERTAHRNAVAAEDAASRAVSRAAPEDRIEAISELKKAKAEVIQAKAALDRCLASAPPTTTPVTVSLADGAIASSAIPCIFPPVVLGDEAYVDGGIRWTLPLLAAVDLDPDRIIAINAFTFGVPPAPTVYRNANILEIGERAVFGLELWETQERHLHAARLLAGERKQQVWVISPRLNVHDGLTVDPGLIDISIAYGYMCAADVTTTFPFSPPTTPTLDLPTTRLGGEVRPGLLVRPTDEARSPSWVDSPTDPARAVLAAAIARCRRECWELEHRAFRVALGAGPVPTRPTAHAPANPDATAFDQLRTLKIVLGLLVLARQQTGGALPAGALAWADSLERHRWTPRDLAGRVSNAFALISGRGWTRPAMTRPRALVAKDPRRADIWLLQADRRRITSTAALAPFGGSSVVSAVSATYIDAFPRGPDIV
jgi:NTE family protein